MREQKRFPNIAEDMARVDSAPETPQTLSPTYRLPLADLDFLSQPALRPLRFYLEIAKPEHVLAEKNVDSTVILFGGARIPAPENKDTARTKTLADLSHFYDEARKFAAAITEKSMALGGNELVVCTGGGPGVMEAGNRGAVDAGGRSVSLNIVLPHEQAPNEYATPELAFNFHYFATRKVHFLLRAKAITVFPGGFGTLDELFEALTLVQTGKMDAMPIILFGRAFWEKIINWEALADSGTIADEDLNLFHFVETAEEALAILDEKGVN